MITITVGERTVSLHPSRFEFLEAVRRTGSIAAASADQGISYRSGLNWIKEIEKAFGGKPVQSIRGGKKHGQTRLTDFGYKILEQYYLAQSTKKPGFVKSIIELKMSARNVLMGRVKDVVVGEILSLVNVELSGAQEIKSVITTESLTRLDIKPGNSILVIVKATEAMLMKT
ncbi:MAG: TOBE domain-containing protein [Candidatus Caldarchaeum sp.]|nr:TOBE domain-containing protein [Candidatus Caldarchaeum sp.]